MIDIHNHILYNVDDGAGDIDESVEIIKRLKKMGYDKLLLTPHYISNTKYNVRNSEKEEKLNLIKKKCYEEKIDIDLFLGNEVYIDEDDDINTLDNIKTLNGSRYILIELPLTSKNIFVDVYINRLRDRELIPVIAHPERYILYYKDFQFFNELIRKGCLLQGNIGSLYGIYGRRAKKMLRYLLKKDMITFLGTDVHKRTDKLLKKNFGSIFKKVNKITKSREKTSMLLHKNADKVVNNEFVYNRRKDYDERNKND